MDEEIPLTNWLKEKIPDKSPDGEDYLLYRHIHNTYIKERNPKRISPSAFKDPKGHGISTDWSKYSTPKETQKRPKNHPPEEYGVISLVIRRIRMEKALKKLTIEHAPIQKTKLYKGNRAHTNIRGILKYGRSNRRNEAQIHLSRIAKWIINSQIGLD